MFTTLSSIASAARRVGFACLVNVSAGALCAGADIHFVDAASSAPVPPFTNWSTAAATIQDAVDVALDGATIMVNTGVYVIGGALTPGFALSNRVVVTQAVNIISVGGPAVTVIVGARDPDAPRGLGSNAVRGVFVSGGAQLHGFTISNGATFGLASASGHSFFERSGGGVFMNNALLSNCVVIANAAGNYGGGVFGSNGAVVIASHISSNWAGGYGGGMAWPTNGMLLNSVLHGNVVSNYDGGGVHVSASGFISNCIISGNLTQRGSAGGVLVFRAAFVMIDCLIQGNRSATGRGGGMFGNSWTQYRVVVNNCRFEDNSVGGTQYGGGAYFTYTEVNNCLFARNAGTSFGGGVTAYGSPLHNCTIVSNRSDTQGGGIHMLNYAALRNTIVYANRAVLTNDNIYLKPGDTGMTCEYSCTFPLELGAGNISNDPMFVNVELGNYRLQLGSPCINAGSNAYARGAYDLDGQPRIQQGIVDMGAYENVPEPCSAFALILMAIYGFRPSRGRRELCSHPPFLKGADAQQRGISVSRSSDARSSEIPLPPLEKGDVVQAARPSAVYKATHSPFAIRYSPLSFGHFFSLLSFVTAWRLSCAATCVALPPHVPGELVVQFKSGRSTAARMGVRTRFGAELRRALPSASLELWHVDQSNVSVDVLAQYVSADPAVAFAEPNFIYSIDRIPDDPLFDQLWGLRNTGQSGGTPGVDIGAADAWDYSTGGDVIVAVIDTGVDYTHPDLVSNMWRNPGEIPGNGIDDDGNGYVDDIYGIDTANGDSDPFDDNDHGTHCAGIIAAVGNNTTGIAGVCWRARIMALKFLSASGSGTSFNAIELIHYALRHGARVLNNSWGGGPYSQALQNAIGVAQASNVLFCAAAGNGGTDGIGDDNDVTPHYPSSYTNANVLAVAAMDRNDTLAVFSNYGSNSVHLAAPGRAILSCVAGGTYESWGGTSMATPHVAGAAALLWSFNPYLSAMDVKDALLRGVVSAPAYQNKTLTGGRLNVFNAFRSVTGLFFDHGAYFPNTAAEVMLVNSNFSGAGTVPIILRTSAGDVEPLILVEREAGGHVFTNAVGIAYGSPIVSNGMVEGIHDTEILALHPTMTVTGRARVRLALEITISTPALVLPYVSNALAISGYNNGTVAVQMLVSNMANGAAQHVIATNLWATAPLPLADHTDVNPFVAIGENAFGFGATASVVITRLSPQGITNYAATSGAHIWPYATWQSAATSVVAAVNTAPDGNLVLVRSGMYYETELIVARPVTVRGADGAAQTVLHAGGQGRVLRIATNALVEGLTLQGGSNRYGGGAHVSFGTLRACVVRDSVGSADGGGVYLTQNGQLEQCLILSNFSYANGGGVYIADSGIVQQCVLEGNRSVLHGGGVYLRRGGFLSRSRLRRNYAFENGGGVYSYAFGGPTGLVADCLIEGNIGRKFGGGISFYYGGELWHGTLVSNRAELLAGGGVHTYRGGAVRNSIVMDNSAGLGHNYYIQSGSAIFDYNCIMPNPGGLSNIIADPLWTQDGSWYLLGGSPAINRAGRQWTTNSVDCAGAPRIFNAEPDLGAFEYHPGALQCYVTASETVVEPFTNVVFTAQVWGTNITGIVAVFDFGDAVMDVLTGTLTVTHAYTALGDYTVRLTVSNSAAEQAVYERWNYISVVPDPCAALWLALALLISHRQIR